MATYPNNYRTGVGFLPNYSFYGIMPYFTYNAELGTGAGSRLNWQIGSDGGGFARTASCPDGYGMKTPFPPVKAGSMSAWNDPVASLTMTANILSGGPMQGTADLCTMSSAGDMSMIVSMSATGPVVTLTGENNVLALTIGLNGAGTIEFSGTSGLSMIVPFDGAFSSVLSGISDLRGKLSMAGEWTPFTELSPEGLAKAVLNARVADYAEAGTVGNAIGMASSGGVDYEALRNAVWEHPDAQDMKAKLLEAWGRLGLDPDAPLVTGQTSITFGQIVMAMTGNDTSTTVTRQ